MRRFGAWVKEQHTGPGAWSAACWKPELQAWCKNGGCSVQTPFLTTLKNNALTGESPSLSYSTDAVTMKR